MDEIKIGFCNVCGNTRIFEVTQSGIVFTPEYSELYLKYSNGSIGRHGVCSSCLASITDEQVNELFEKLRSMELDQLVGSGTDKQFDKVRKTSLFTWGRNLNELQDKIKEIMIQL